MRGVAIARVLKKKNPESLMPREYHIITARRFLSLYEPGHAEDVFPYYNASARWKELSAMRTPVAIVIGARDEHLDRPARKLIDIFSSHARHVRSFEGMVIKGANHGFAGKEKELAESLLWWIKSIHTME